MNKGSTVKIVDPGSAFRGMIGKIQHVRTPSLPFGVQIKGRRPLQRLASMFDAAIGRRLTYAELIA